MQAPNSVARIEAAYVGTCQVALNLQVVCAGTIIRACQVALVGQFNMDRLPVRVECRQNRPVGTKGSGPAADKFRQRRVVAYLVLLPSGKVDELCCLSIDSRSQMRGLKRDSIVQNQL